MRMRKMVCIRRVHPRASPRHDDKRGWERVLCMKHEGVCHMKQGACVLYLKRVCMQQRGNSTPRKHMYQPCIFSTQHGYRQGHMSDIWWVYLCCWCVAGMFLACFLRVSGVFLVCFLCVSGVFLFSMFVWLRTLCIPLYVCIACLCCLAVVIAYLCQCGVSSCMHYGLFSLAISFSLYHFSLSPNFFIFFACNEHLFRNDSHNTHTATCLLDDIVGATQGKYHICQLVIHVS